MVTELKPICYACGKTAKCVGRYEDGPIQFCCNECCGHGNEDGWCIMLRPLNLPEIIGMANSLIADIKSDAEFDAARRPAAIPTGEGLTEIVREFMKIGALGQFSNDLMHERFWRLHEKADAALRASSTGAQAEGVTKVRCAATTVDQWYKPETGMRCSHRASVGEYCKKHAKQRNKAMSEQTPIQKAAESFIQSLTWSPDVTNWEKTLVAGNVRGFAASLESSTVLPKPEARPEGEGLPPHCPTVVYIHPKPEGRYGHSFGLHEHQDGTGDCGTIPSCESEGCTRIEVRSPAAPEAWRPMETAPRDGTRVLVLDPWRFVIIAEWSAPLWYIRDADAYCRPTAWQPLPQPPSPSTTEKEG